MIHAVLQASLMIISTDFWYFIHLVKGRLQTETIISQTSLKNVVFLHLCYAVLCQAQAFLRQG